MLSRRYELKFPIAVSSRERFLDAAREGLSPDPHGELGVYRVSSVYFDTADLEAYWQKLDGEEIRAKYRLRYYGFDDPDRPDLRAAFMEIKHRANNTLFKERVRLTLNGARTILDDPRELIHLAAHLDPADRDRRSTLDAVIRAAGRPGFRAVNTITYRREAWMGRHDSRLRITFDTLGEACAPAAWADVAGRTGRPLFDPRQAIMEVKFDRAIPRWVRDILARQRIRLERFSKYATGVEMLGLAGSGVAPPPVRTTTGSETPAMAARRAA